MTRFLLLCHAVASVFLLGAVTHQAFAVRRATSGEASFLDAFRRVQAARYARPIAALLLAATALGALVYPAFRVGVRTASFEAADPRAAGLFELKEHFAALALAVLPAYAMLWRRPEPAHDRFSRAARGALTAFVAAACWWSFLVGHVLNNIKGL